MKIGLILCLLLVPLAGCAPGTLVSIHSDGWGTGFVVGQAREGWIIATARHVVEDANDVLRDAVLVNGRVGVVLWASDSSDAALVLVPRLPQDSWHSWTLGPLVGAGGRVTALGQHYRGVRGPSGRETVLDGQLAAPGTIFAPSWIEDGQEYFCTTAPVYPGMSGGPILDRWGRVVGIISQYPRLRGLPGMAFSLGVPMRAIPKGFLH